MGRVNPTRFSALEIAPKSASSVRFIQSQGNPLAPPGKWFQNGCKEVYQAINREAKKQGRSLNAQIIQTLETQAAQLDRQKQLDKVRAELEEFVASQKPMDSSAPVIRRERMKR